MMTPFDLADVDATISLWKSLGINPEEAWRALRRPRRYCVMWGDVRAFMCAWARAAEAAAERKAA